MSKWQSNGLSFAKSRPYNNWEWFSRCVNDILIQTDINLKKRWADVFQIYPNAIHLNPFQFCPAMPLLGFPVFCLSSSLVLNRYFHILVNSMTIWSVLKLPKIAWSSPFNILDTWIYTISRLFDLTRLLAHLELFDSTTPTRPRATKKTNRFT